MPHTSIPAAFDHLVYATPGLERTLERLEAQLGVTPLPGGTHPAWGTRNALLPLSGTSYLEIIGPDPGRPAHQRPEIFGITRLHAPRLVTWAVKARNLATLVAHARAHHLPLGATIPGSRQQPDGTTLRWEYTDPLQVVEEGLVPFFIDWGDSPHPASAGPPSLTLTGFRAEHPEPDALRRTLAVLGLGLAVDPGPARRLIARFMTPKGEITL